jgi:hypothetical protein
MQMVVLKSANLVAAFLLELCALAALAVWGVYAGQGTLLKLVLGVGAPLLMAVVWGLFVAPRALVHVSPSVRMLLKVVIFAVAAFALLVAGHALLAAVFALAVAANLLLVVVWRQ